MSSEVVKEASKALIKALLEIEPDRKVLAEKLRVSLAYLSYLSNGKRIASLDFCKKIKTAFKDYPYLTALCLAIQYKKIDLD